MLIIHNASEVQHITHSGIRKLVALRFQQLGPSAPPATPCVSPDGYFIVVGGGDAVSEIEHAAGFPILSGLFDGLPFGDPDFQPCSEILEEHNYEQQHIYEIVFIGSDTGTFTCVLIPDENGIDADLLAMCRSWATPAVSLP